MPPRSVRRLGPQGRVLLLLSILALVAGTGLAFSGGRVPVAHAAAARSSHPHATSALPPIKHVFVIVEENESASTTFGSNSPAPYLSKTLTAQGAYLPNYYGIGHSSLDNYIAMVSGQAPTSDTSADCQTSFAAFPGDSMDANGQENSGNGCVYPKDVPTLMQQMDNAGLSWRGYMDDMPSACDHPAVGTPDLSQGETPTNQYATRHNPFVYFHYVIDNTAECNADDVNLSQLSTDLRSAATTPNFSFITPDVCDDGHDGAGEPSNCNPGGLQQADSFLKTVVPEITSSPAYQQNGLLMIIFDEAATSDASACCGEIPGPEEASPGGSGPGGGDTGAVFLSPYITPGTVSQTPYNHYTMLGSVENIFGLSHIGYAGLPGSTYFGSDIFTHAPAAITTTQTTATTTPTATTPVTPAEVIPRDSGAAVSAKAFAPAGTGTKKQKHVITISYRDSAAALSTLTVTRQLAGYRLTKRGACRVLATGHRRPSHTSKCTVIRTLGSFTHQDVAGRNRVSFNGRLQGHSLAKGVYTLTIRPKLQGRRGAIISVRFTVI